jgi:hypothetical protein
MIWYVKHPARESFFCVSLYRVTSANTAEAMALGCIALTARRLPLRRSNFLGKVRFRSEDTKSEYSFDPDGEIAPPPCYL